MAAKVLLVICAQACFVQSVFSQCVGRAGLSPLAGAALLGPGLTYDGLTLGACGGAASTGGGFPVTSTSPIAPTGVNVVSENLYEGALVVEGNLPLLGSVAVEGALGTAGAGAVSYGCGDGSVGIVTEGPIATGILSHGAAGPGIGLGYGPGLFSGAIGGIGHCGYGIY